MPDNTVNVSDTISSSEKILGNFTKIISDTITGIEALSILAILPLLQDTGESSSRMLIVVVYPEINKLTFPIKKRIEVFNNALVYTDGSEQRRLDIDEPRYKIVVTYASLTKTEKDQIYNFFNSVAEGRRKTFLWKDPKTKDDYFVRFIDDILDVNHFTYDLYELNRVEFIETDYDWIL